MSSNMQGFMICAITMGYITYRAVRRVNVGGTPNSDSIMLIKKVGFPVIHHTSIRDLPAYCTKSMEDPPMDRLASSMIWHCLKREVYG